jgi:hypothetical protein
MLGVVSLVCDQTFGRFDGGDDRLATVMSATFPGVSAKAIGRPR